MKKQNFSRVRDTLFIPLAARVAVSQRFPEYFYDETAMKFRDMEQVRAIPAKNSEYSSIASAAGYYNMDRFASDFLIRHPAGPQSMYAASRMTGPFSAKQKALDRRTGNAAQRNYQEKV